MIVMNVQIMHNAKGNYWNWSFYGAVVTTLHRKLDILHATKFQPQIHLQRLFGFDKNTVRMMQVRFFLAARTEI